MLEGIDPTQLWMMFVGFIWSDACARDNAIQLRDAILDTQKSLSQQSHQSHHPYRREWSSKDIYKNDLLNNIDNTRRPHYTPEPWQMEQEYRSRVSFNAVEAIRTLLLNPRRALDALASHPDMRLRVWFNQYMSRNGIHGLQRTFNPKNLLRNIMLELEATAKTYRDQIWHESKAKT